jgi:tetraacyldisaccharide 4'-kinase
MRLLLSIFSVFSRFVCRIKRILYGCGIIPSERAPLAVISVGNLALGGSEKTPLAMELIGFFLSLGRRPALVTRGYKGTWEQRGGVLSDGASMSGGWIEAGDEPYLAALKFPGTGVYVGRDRAASCRRAREAGFDVAILDDGFQHLRLRRDLDIVLHDPKSRTPLREGRSALHAAGIVLLKNDAHHPAAGAEPASDRPRIFSYSVREQGLVPLAGGANRPLSSLIGRRVFAFSGIARPERFFNQLAGSGVFPAARRAFPDHYNYPGSALEEIAATALAAGCDALLTTEKDAVKLRGRLEPGQGAEAFVLLIGLELPVEFFEAVRAAVEPSEQG